VTFDIDANGILNVKAHDKATSNEQQITITSSSGLSKDEVDKMARDADAHVADDRRRKEEIEARNRADVMTYNTEKMLREHRDKISEADAREIEAALSEVKSAMGAGGTDRLNAAIDKLTRATHKLAEAMYRATAQPPTGGGGGDGPQQRPAEAPPKDNVVDAEFVDMDDKEKK